MKSCTRLGFCLIVLSLGTLWSGCANRSYSNATRGGSARDFEIVETATKRELTTKEMNQLRVMVAEYLAKEGVKEGGDYYVKIFLAPDQPGAPEEWVVVRFTQASSYTATRFTLLSSYPSYYDGYSSYYSYDYYPYSPFGFSRFSLQYYDYPFGYSGYYPYTPSRPRYTNHFGHDRDKGDKGDKGDRDHKPDGRPHPHGPVFGGTPPGSTAGYRDPQRVTRTRWDGNWADDNNRGTVPQTGSGISARNDAIQRRYPRTPTPADYTPAYVPPATDTTPRNSNRVRTTPEGRSDNRYERFRSGTNSSTTTNRDTTVRNRDYGTNRQNYRSNPSTQNSTQSTPTPTRTYTPPPSRSDPPPRHDPPTQYSPPARSDPPSYSSPAPVQSEPVSRPSRTEDVSPSSRGRGLD
jgi:hypothetical protein